MGSRESDKTERLKTNTNHISTLEKKKHIIISVVKHKESDKILPTKFRSKAWVLTLTIFFTPYCSSRGFPVAQMAKNLPAIQETWVPSLGREDTLEKGVATHSSILAWRIPWSEEPGGLQSVGLQRVGHD